MKKTIVVYTQMGYTFLYKGVSNLKHMNHTIEFDYEGDRTGTVNHQVFHNAAGYSVLGEKKVGK